MEGKKEEEEKKDSCYKLAKFEVLMVLSDRNAQQAGKNIGLEF